MPLWDGNIFSTYIFMACASVKISVNHKKIENSDILISPLQKNTRLGRLCVSDCRYRPNPH